MSANLRARSYKSFHKKEKEDNVGLRVSEITFEGVHDKIKYILPNALGLKISGTAIFIDRQIGKVYFNPNFNFHSNCGINFEGDNNFKTMIYPNNCINNITGT